MGKDNKTSSLYFPKQIKVAMESICDYPLTVVEAPMGYGKTTAVRDYLNNFKANELWVRIHDDLISGFWNGLCNTLEEFDEKIYLSLKELGFPDDSISLQEALKLFRKIKLPEKTFLIIEDYHLINKPEVANFIKFLTVSEIINLHIILIARFIEFEKIEELSLKGYLYHITKETFELTPVEIKKYYKLCGIILKDSDCEKLYNLTEGWFTALYLLMLNYIKYDSFEANRDIYKLIENTIYLNFSDEIKELLHAISLFDSFSLELAIFLSGNENVEKLLSEIISENAFVKYEEKTKTYRVHHIFSKYLQYLFHRSDLADRRQLYQRIASYHMKNGHYVQAMENSYMASDFENLLCALEEDKGHSIHSEQKEAFLRYFEECPKQVRQLHPIAILIYAICLFSFNEMERFHQACREFEELVRNNDKFDKEELRELNGEFELLLSFTKYNNVQEMYQHISKAAMLLKRPANFLDTKSSWTFGSPSVLYMFYREPGTLKEELKKLKEAIQVYKKLTNGHGTGGESIMEAEYHFNRGDFQSAEIFLNKAFYPANRNGQGDIVISTMLLQARIRITKGDYPSALTILKRMRQKMTQKRWYGLMYTIDLCEAFLYSGLKQDEKIPLWVKEGDLDSSKLYFPTRAFYNIIYGRVLLIKGEYLKILGISEELIMEASIFPNLLSMIYIYIYVAAANLRIHRRHDAVAAIEQAIHCAKADKVYMPFVENCDYIKPLLEELYREGICREDISTILELYQSYHVAVEQIIKEYFTESRLELTKREKEIALLAAKGLTNKEIGENLFISANTVKMALKNIFSKLSINNRALLKQYLNNF